MTCQPEGQSPRYAGRLVGIASLLLMASGLTAGLEYGGLTFGEASPESLKTVPGEFHGCEVAKAASPNDKIDAGKWAADAVTKCTVILTTGSEDEASSIWEEFVFQRGALEVVTLRASDTASFENLVSEVAKKYSEYPANARPFLTIPERRRIVIVNRPIRVGPGVEPPKLVKRIEPAYPAAVRKARLEGVVIVEAVISAEGNVENPRLLKSPDAKLAELALHAVAQWKYRPAMLYGDPIPVYLTVTSTFNLNQ